MSAHSHVRRASTVAVRTFAALAFALCPVCAVWAAEKVQFDIPRGPATDTLSEYAAQSGLQVLFGYDDVRGIETNEVHGELDPAVALTIMAKGTRLNPRFMDADAVTLTVLPPGRVHAQGSGQRLEKESQRPVVDRRSLASPVDEVTIRAKPERPSIGQIGSNLITLTRTDIDALGVPTTQAVLRTVPQVFGGGPSEDTQQGFEAHTNAGSGSGVNLRGLGAGSTLVLVNGRRMSGSGTDGIFVDISNLPLSIVESIEILPDSSSTRYGADAVGGVVNFVLTDSFGGAQTDAFYGAATQSPLHENQVSQLFGGKRGGLSGLLAFDYYDRENLPAADRRQARSDLRIFGGDNFDTPQNNPGTIIATATTTGTFLAGPWAIPTEQDGTQLSSSNLIPGKQNLQNWYANADVLPTQKRLSLYGTGNWALKDVKLFADIFYGERDVHSMGPGTRATLMVPASNAFLVNPTGQRLPVLVGYDFTDDLGPMISNGEIRTTKVITGLDFEPDDIWRFSGTADFASEKLDSRIDNGVDFAALTDALRDSNRATALNVFGDGSHTNPATLAGLRTSLLFDSEAKIGSGSFTGSRALPLGRGNAGTLMLGVDWRRQSLSSRSATLAAVQISHDLARTVRAAFIAVSVPLFDRLELSLGERYEHYSDFGARRSPRLGLTWMPLNGVAVRGTWSKSLRPPNLVDLDESGNYVSLGALRDPSAPGGLANVLVQVGKNAHLHEERAENWTLGVDFEPTSMPGLSLALTYFDTNFKDRMSVPTFAQNLLVDPAMADLIVRNPTPEQIGEVCNSARFFGTLPSCSTLPITAIADLRVRNSAYVRTNGLDVLAQYTHRMTSDSLTFGLDGTYILSFKNAERPGSVAIERVSTQSNPIDLRLQGSVEWKHRDLMAGAHINYTDGYRDTASIPHRSVASWTTMDLRLAYSVEPNVQSWLSGTTLALNAENVLDRNPPFLNNPIGIGYDQENGDLTGRTLSISLRKKW